MTPATWITMFATVGLVWGGFAVVLLTAARKEAEKEE